MPAFESPDPELEKRIRGSFARQRVMQTIGATMTRVSPGEVEIAMPFREDLTQQHGILHAGVVSIIADSACGYAAYSLMPADAAVLTVEYKVNFLSPAQGDRVVARARVTKHGRTVTVSTCDVFAVTGGREQIVATMLGTLMTIRERPGLTG
jgi:uncharacterized protein (TIGR00369 family)